MAFDYKLDYETAKARASEYLTDCRKWRKYYIGELWDEIGSKDEEASQPEINYIRPNVMQLLAMLQLKHPAITANPREKTDALAADIISAALSIIYDTQGLSHFIRLATQDMLVYDRGYVGGAWNPISKNIEFFNISPFNIFIDPIAKTLKEAEYCHITHLRSERYMKDKYQKDIKASDTDEFTGASGVLVIESWYKPSTEFQTGKHIIWINGSDKPIVEDEGVYPQLAALNMFPIVEFVGDATTTGEKRSMVADMWGAQEIYMKTMGYLLDNLMLTQNCQYKAKGDPSQFPETIPNKPGAVHTTVGDIEALVTPQLSPAWQNMLVMVQGLFPDISGVRQVNYGNTSSGVTAASAIVALQEAGKTIKELKEDGVIAAAKDIGKICVAMMDDFYTDDEWMRTVGEVPVEENMSLRYDIGIEYTEALPQDKATRMNIAKALVDSQILDPQGFAEIIGDTVLLAKIQDSQGRIQQKAQQAQQMQMQMQMGGQNATGQPTSNSSIT
jgi:hypothetical protein